MKRTLGTLAAGLALGVGMALAVAGPDLQALDEALPGVQNDDGLGAITLHFGFGEALAAGRWDLRDPQQFYPVGRSRLQVDGGNSLEFVVSSVTRRLLPWPAWLSVAWLAWIPLNLLAFLPLGLHLWGRAGPALAAGAAWAVYGPLLGQLAAGRLTQVVLLGLPLAVLGLLRVAEEGGRRAWVQAGLGFALTGLGYWFYALFMALIAPLFALWGLRHRALAPLAADLGRGAALALGLVAPLLLVLAWPALTGGWTPAPAITAEFASPVFPDALPLAGALPTHLRGWLPGVLVAGAAVTLWRGQRRALWVGALTLCVLFALGPGQRLGDRVWLLPYYPLWRWLPGLDRMLHPERWLAVGSLFFTVLAADGLARWRPALVWALPIGVLLHNQSAGALPLGHWSYQAPPVWDAAARGPAGALIVLPLLDAARAVPALPFHQRPMLGGMGEQIPVHLPPALCALIEGNSLLLQLLGLSRGQLRELSVHQEDLDALRALGFGQIVLDEHSRERSVRARNLDLRGPLEAALGAALYTGPDGAAWALPAAGRPGPGPRPALRVIEMGPPGDDPRGGAP